MHNETNKFLDSLDSHSCLSLIVQPTKIPSHSNTFIDNIVSNVSDRDIISESFKATISDHWPQFAMITNIFSNISINNSNIYKKDWLKFDQENFILEYFSVQW